LDRFAGFYFAIPVLLVLVECATTSFCVLGRCHSPSEYVVIIATSSAVRGASARSRFQYLAGRADSSNNFRINVWAAVVEMIRDRPILGIGPGNTAFNKIYPLYQRLVLMPECLSDPAGSCCRNRLDRLSLFYLAVVSNI